MSMIMSGEQACKKLEHINDLLEKLLREFPMTVTAEEMYAIKYTTDTLKRK